VDPGLEFDVTLEALGFYISFSFQLSFSVAVGNECLKNIFFLCTGAFLYGPYSFLMISNSFWMGGRVGGLVLNRTSTVMLLNRTGGVVWALKLPCALVHKTTYALPLALVMDAAGIKSITHGPYKSLVRK
jgi:hypothetical protein